MKAFWDTAPCVLVEADRRFRDAYCLHQQGDIAQMMTVVSASEASVNCYVTRRRTIPQGCHPLDYILLQDHLSLSIVRKHVML
jgi:hypothetical protein